MIREDELNPLAVLRKISERLAPGRSPSYMEAHVLKALELVSEQVIGRAALGRQLGFGEGTARTMVKHLREAGLIEVTRRGISLTELGGRMLTQLRGTISRGAEAPKSGHTVGTYNHAVLVKRGADHIRLGVEQRDAALMAGAEGATTLLFDGIHFHMPGMETELDSSLTQFLVDRFNPEAGDIVIIGTADSLTAAEIGAKMAALELLREMTDPPGLDEGLSRPLDLGLLGLLDEGDE